MESVPPSPYVTSQEAYVTLLVNDNFAIGAEVLLYTLLKYRDKDDKRDILVLVTPNVSPSVRSKLSSLLLPTTGASPHSRIQIIVVDPIPNPNVRNTTTKDNKVDDTNTTTDQTSTNTSTAPSSSIETSLPSSSSTTLSSTAVSATTSSNVPHVQGWIDSGYTKLRIWSLTNYTRLLYLDADMLIIETGISKIWYYPSPVILSSSDSTSEDSTDNVHFRIPPCAVPDVFPPDKFNAGLLLIKPDIRIFNDMLTQINVLPSYDGGDTGFLNAYFPSWYTTTLHSSQLASLPSFGDSRSPYHSSPRLPFGYNAQRILYWFTNPKAPGYWRSIQPLIILHYSSTPKPWENSKRMGDLELLWWSTMTQMQLDHIRIPTGINSMNNASTNSKNNNTDNVSNLLASFLTPASPSQSSKVTGEAENDVKDTGESSGAK